MLEPVDLLQLRDPHRAARTLQQLIGWSASVLALTRELPEPELEDAGHSRSAAARFDRPVQLRQIPARPETGLELVGAPAGAADDQAFAENDRPR